MHSVCTGVDETPPPNWAVRIRYIGYQRGPWYIPVINFSYRLLQCFSCVVYKMCLFYYKCKYFPIRDTAYDDDDVWIQEAD